MRRCAAVLLLLFAPLAGCKSSSSASSTAPSSTCQSFAPTNTEPDIAAALGNAADGACFTFAAGTYAFNNQLALGTGNDVTITGAGIGATVFDFHAQATGDDAIFGQSVKNLTLTGFTVKDAPGNGIKMLSVDGLTYDAVEVAWTPGNASMDGPYGLYPVQCTDVLVENCKVSGASDSGIYIGQSQNIVVEHNEVYQNVAGIEIENSYSADVHDNDSHNNTAGILVFSLPGLQQEGGHSIRVYSNTITDNNTENFGAMGDIVHIVPAGTGSFVMACDHVEFFDNTYTGNETGATAVISYYDSQLPISDPKYYAYPSSVYFHDNLFSGNGMAPDSGSQFGLLLISGASAFPDMRVSDSAYDGVLDPAKGTGTNPMNICFQEPHANAVCDLNLEKLNKTDSNLAQIMTCETPSATPFNCKLPALPAVTFPGVTGATGATN